MADGGDISLPDISKLNDLQDDQIEALIAKLAEVQTHAPQIIAALQEQQEARSRGSKSYSSKERQSSSKQNRDPPSKGKAKPPPPQIEEEEEEEEGEDDGDDFDENYDDFDEDAEYPMVGDGFSDEISVVSDMTTPTVVSSMDINEEEYYKDMVVGGRKVTAPKKKDMLSQVARVNARKAPGAGAAAAPKKKSIVGGGAEGGGKKPSRPNQLARQPPAAAASVPGPKKKSSKLKKEEAPPSSSGTGTGTGPNKKVKKKVVAKPPPAANGESSSGAPKKKAPQEQSKPSGPVMIDDDGFLVDPNGFTAFDSANNPFSSTPFTADVDGGDSFDNFGGFVDFGAPAPSPAKKAPARPKRIGDGSRPSKKSGTGSVTGTNKTKKKGSRRSSLGA